VIKGPGSRVYGAGTGGVLLIESMSPTTEPAVFSEYATGSYGLQNIYGSASFGHSPSINKIGYQHQESDGYRDHSALRRNVATWTGQYKFSDNNLLKTTFLYGDLFYETPGALTKQEYQNDPRAARPGNAFFPGAEAARASISQKQFIAGASYDQSLSSRWKNTSTLYGMFTELRNPTIQNYGRSSEPHI
jgi:iron complex outermembrane receptor protein